MNRLLSFLMAGVLAACTQIDTGNVGVESTLGQVKPETMPPGVYFTMFKTLTEVCAKEVPIQINDLKPQTSDKITLADMDLDVYVMLDPSKASTVMTKWTGDRTDVKDGDCVALGQNFILRQAREAVYDVASRLGSATIHTERVRIAAETQKMLQTSLDTEAGKGMFAVRSVNVRNMVTDPALEANIKAAAQAQFREAEELNKLKSAKIEAERKRVEAQGNADAVRINAEAVAKAGGKEYIELEAIKKWDGKLPTMMGAGAVPFVSVK